MQMKLWDANEEALTTKLGITGCHHISFSKKKNEPTVGLNVVIPRDWFKITTSKWHKIANAVNASGHSPLFQNTTTCKNKWGALYGNFKYIFYYMSLTKKTHHIRVLHHKRKQIKMSFNITTRSFIRWLMYSWGFGQYYAIRMCTISWLRTKMCYCNHILMQNQLCYWVFLIFHLGKMIWCHVHNQHLPNQFQTHKQYIF